MPCLSSAASAAARRARSWRAVAIGSAVFGPALVAVLACGANELDAPERQVPQGAQLQQCRGFEELMPRFTSALESGQTEGLRVLMKNHLLKAENPAVNDVLRAIFVGMARFAAEPPELGAVEGEVCAAVPPPIEDAHPLCEMRRAMDSLVHEGRGMAALSLTDPLLAAVFNYVEGNPPAATRPHWEVAATLSKLCQQNSACRTDDTLDLLIGFSTYMETQEGRAAIDRMVALVNNPSLEPFLKDDGAQYGGENGIVALADILITTVLGMDDPADLDSLPIDSLPQSLRANIDPLMADLKSILSPTREPNILVPLKKVLNCYRTGDENRELIRMVYRLGLEANVPEFGLTTIMGAVQGLRDTDPRGTLIHLVLTLAKSLRQDEQAMYSLATVCQQVFSNDVTPGETKSPAQMAIPVIADLFEQGVAGEAICAIDTLVYGCAGGSQPACEAAQ